MLSVKNLAAVISCDYRFQFHLFLAVLSKPMGYFLVRYSKLFHFYPTALKGCRGIVFTHGVRMGGRASCRAGGWAGGGKKFVRAVSQKL